MKCDKCNSKMKIHYFTNKRLPYHFCPNCGADMRTKEND